MTIDTIKVAFIGIITLISSLFGSAPQTPPIPDQYKTPEAVEESLGAYGITGGGTYRLKASISSSDTSITLSSFKEPVSNLKYSMTSLNTAVGYGTIDPQTTRPEFISFSGITQNSDGSATLTGVTRGLTKTPQGSACTASTTLAVRHPGQSIFILSDSPCHFSEYAIKRNDETISGSWTFGSPTTGGNPATKTYVDSLVNGGTVSTDKVTVAATAGETIGQGQIVYLNTADGEWYKTDADTLATTENVMLGIAQGAGTDGNGISGGVIIHGLDSATQGSTLTPGQTLYISGTAGATSTITGTFFRQLGISRTTSSFYFDPYIAISTTTNATTTNLFVSGTCIGCTYVHVQDFTTSGNWVKPVSVDNIAHLEHVMVIAVGAGGGGGGGCGSNGAQGGGGGGGGAVNIKYLEADRLASRVWVQVGTTTAGTIKLAGVDGTFSSFGTSSSPLVYAGGGGGGKTGCAGGSTWGGAGGSWFGGVTNATGSPMSASSTINAFSGAGPEGTNAGRPAEWGGASGGGVASTTGSKGGSSLYGAGAGGGGGDSGQGGSAGGSTGQYGFGNGGAGGVGAGDAGTAGTTATSTGFSTYAGSGGGGGGTLSSAGTGGAGGNGGYPGGGGGGGGGSDTLGGVGGRGAPGWVRVIAW